MTKSRPKIIDREYGGGVFFLWGEDEYSKGEAANELVGLHLDESTRDFNLDVIHGSDINIEDLSRMVATPPMMAEWRVVMVKVLDMATMISMMTRLLAMTTMAMVGLVQPL